MAFFIPLRTIAYIKNIQLQTLCSPPKKRMSHFSASLVSHTHRSCRTYLLCIFTLYRRTHFMHIPEERGFIYASSIVTAELVLLVSIITSSAILWSHGFGPEFIH